MLKLYIFIAGLAGTVQAQEIEIPFLECSFGETNFQLAEQGDEFAWIGKSFATTARVHTGNAFGAVIAYALGPNGGPQILVVYTGEFADAENPPIPGTAMLVTVSVSENATLEFIAENGKCEQLD